MKKILAILGIIVVIGLIGLTLVKNKTEMTEKAKITKIESYPVSVVTVAKENLADSLTQIGEIVANNDVNVAAEQTGKVIAVMVKEGSYVSAGAPLVKLDDLLSQTQFATAKVNYEKAQRDWERYQTLRKQEVISDTELEAARLQFKSAEASYISAQRQYHNSVVTSPISGVVTSRPVNIGTMINPGTVVANVVDTSIFKVKLNIGEQNAFRLKTGDLVIVETDVYPGVKMNGRIESISAKSDTAHSYPVQVLIPNANKQYPLKSGMYGKVTFILPSQDALTIPRTALVGSINDPKVYVVEGNNAKLRPIVVGSEVGNKITIVQGLSEGETVVFAGQDNLKDNIPVTIVK